MCVILKTAVPLHLQLAEQYAFTNDTHHVAAGRKLMFDGLWPVMQHPYQPCLGLGTPMQNESAFSHDSRSCRAS